MRNRRLPLSLALCIVPALGAAAACGSSSNQNGADAGTDSGSTPDVSVAETGASDGTAPGDSSTGAISDGASAPSDGAVLGANCPAVDAGTFTEAPHAPLPTVAYWGGPILTAPQVVTFTFSTTPSAAQLQAYGQTITQSYWFSQVTKDYGYPDGGAIQPGLPGVAVDMTVAAAPVYIDTFGQGTATGGVDLEQFIVQQVSAAVAAKTIPAPSANSLYAFYFPPTSTIWMGAVNQGAQSCQGFGGYHSATTYTDGTTPIVYAILPDCSSGNPQYDYEGVTIAASHEIVEATTDPGTNQSLAWYLDQSQQLDGGISLAEYRNDPWANSEQFGEVGDNCESIPLDVWPLDDAGTLVQRIWSTSAAALGHNPCVPVPQGETYYNASTDKALYVAAVGDTFTVDVSAFSDGARPSWRLDAIDQTPTQNMPTTGNIFPYLKMEFVNGTTRSDGVSTLTCVNNGSTGQLKVTLLADPTTDTSLSNDEFPEADGAIYSADVANGYTVPGPDGGPTQAFPYQFWPFAIITPATAATLGVTSAGISDPRQLAALRAAHRHGAPRHFSPPPRPVQR